MRDALFAFADLEALIAFVGALTFLILYVSLFNWRKTAEGRAVFYFVLSLVAVTFLTVMTLWLGPDFFWREWIRLVLWAYVAFSSWRLVYVLFTNLRKGKRNPISLELRHPTGPVNVKKED